jgi:hypothetical protein
MSNDNKLKNYYPEKYKEHYNAFAENANGYSFNTHDFYLENYGLQEVPQEYRSLFLYSFSLEVMLDEIMYTYFSFHHCKRDKMPDDTSINSVYSRFSEVFRSPKLNFCGHGPITRNPWSVHRVIENRDRVVFKQLISDFFEHSEEKFNEDRKLPEWQRIITIIKNDKDIHPLVRDIALGAITVSQRG